VRNVVLVGDRPAEGLHQQRCDVLGRNISRNVNPFVMLSSSVPVPDPHHLSCGCARNRPGVVR
jgi:hypothetical protein